MVRVSSQLLGMTLLCRNGTRSLQYEGEMTTVEIVKWVNRRMAPPSRRASCEALASRMIDRLNLVYFGDFEGELFETYLEVAKSNDVYT